jgi:Tryptophan halogenase
VITLNKIVIVGGGSAGWMSAATMIKKFPNKEIVVIESPDYPIIGVGESTVGGFRAWSKWIGIEDKDFMPHTDAVYKLSIKFTDFFKKDSGSFHYPFGVPYTEGTELGAADWYIKKAKYPEIPNDDYADRLFPSLTLAKKNKISFNEKGNLGNFKLERDSAYHFDATKFGQWLKNNYCVPRGVTIIPQSVESVNTNENGVESLFLTDGSLVTADLFIDCTGFKALLLEQSLGEPFKDFSNMLPNNSAWATRIPYTDKELEMEPYTNCTAISNGWVWNIPSWERIGTGYVFSDKYVSPEEALKEFKDHLRSDKMTIHDPNRDVDSYDYKLIKFRTGIHERTFVKNVVAIGFAAGFIEPLESNGLYSVHEFLFRLVKCLERGTVTQWDRDAYNYSVKNEFAGFIEFVALHYALSNRDDTKYWRDITEKVFDEKLPRADFTQYKGFTALADVQMNSRDHDMWQGIHCISTGMGYFPVNATTIEHWKNYWGIDYYNKIEKTMSLWELYEQLWQKEANESPTMYQWLLDNIHND